jgi:hypothetical protein
MKKRIPMYFNGSFGGHMTTSSVFLEELPRLLNKLGRTIKMDRQFLARLVLAYLHL